MADDAPGITTNDPWCLAVQLAEDRWIEIDGVISYVDGHCHKIDFPGFMTRSGESFGLTATFHTVEKAWRDGDVDRGDISRLVMVNGLLMTVETIAKGVELLRHKTAPCLEQETTAGKMGADPLAGVPEEDLLEEYLAQEARKAKTEPTTGATQDGNTPTNQRWKGEDVITEHDWLECTRPRSMIVYLNRQSASMLPTQRKQRLLACAYSRYLLADRMDPEINNAIAIAESAADGLGDWYNMPDASANPVVRLPNRVSCWLTENSGLISVMQSFYSLQSLIRDELQSGTVCWEEGVEPTRLVREIFGNPFRPMCLVSSWLTPNVLTLAHTIYEENSFDRLPLLADALEEAGCTNADILAHCRGRGPHVRGCWAIDLVLGEQKPPETGKPEHGEQQNTQSNLSTAILSNKWSSEVSSRPTFALGELPFFDDLPQSGVMPMPMIVEDRIGSEMVLMLYNKTPFVSTLAKMKSLPLILTSGMVHTSHGPVIFLFFHIPNAATPDEPYFGFVNYANPFNSEQMATLWNLANQSHWHLILVDGDQRVRAVEEYENIFGLGETLATNADAIRGKHPGDIALATQEFSSKHTLQDMLNMKFSPVTNTTSKTYTLEIVPGKSIGPFRLGMTIQEINDAMRSFTSEPLTLKDFGISASCHDGRGNWKSLGLFRF